MSSSLYIPVHRRSPSTGSAYASSASRTPSPSSSRSLSPSPSSVSTHLTPYVYTPADLVALSYSPLAQLSADDMDVRLRAVAPEVVQTRRQRKALAWHARHLPTPTPTTGTGIGGRRWTDRRSHTPESEEDRASSWRIRA